MNMTMFKFAAHIRVLLSMLFAIVVSGAAEAQLIPGGRIAARNPGTAMSANIRAQAELIRAQGDAAVRFGQARKLHLEADSMELDLWLQKVRTFYEGKQIRAAAQLEANKMKQLKNKTWLNDQRHRNRLRWERLALHPELVGDNISNGVALNFLLQRLATVDFEVPDSEAGTSIDKQMLSAIRFRLPGSRGERLVISADQKDTLGWPFLLRDKRYDEPRQAFETRWNELLSRDEASPDWSNDELNSLEQSLGKLMQAYFAEHDPLKAVRNKPSEYFQVRAGRRFLVDLDRQVQRLKTVGSSAAVHAAGSYDPSKHGDNVVALLEFMAKNGIEFAPPRPGFEHIYRGLFYDVRKHYLGAVDADQGLQPKDLTEELKE